MNNRPDNFSYSVTQLQNLLTDKWHVDEQASPDMHDGLLVLVVKLHKFNFNLWHEEDKAREPGVEDATIAQVKRNIDSLNQNRNDTIAKIDEFLEQSLFKGLPENPDLPWNSETVGSIVDRLSIASLKSYHMREQAERSDASAEHIQSCQQKVARLLEQQSDLGQALQEFVDDVLAGRKQNRLYRQFKMYNDPTLNPEIYRKSGV